MSTVVSQEPVAIRISAGEIDARGVFSEQLREIHASTQPASPERQAGIGLLLGNSVLIDGRTPLIERFQESLKARLQDRMPKVDRRPGLFFEVTMTPDGIPLDVHTVRQLPLDRAATARSQVISDRTPYGRWGNEASFTIVVDGEGRRRERVGRDRAALRLR